MRFGGGLKFVEAEKKKEYFQLFKTNVHFRQTSEAYVYQRNDDEDWVLAGYGKDPFVINMEIGEFKIESKGKVYMASEIADQTAYVVSDEKYTSLDRPPPLSPEMQAIRRMVRANEIARDKQMRELEARYARDKRTTDDDSDVVEELPEKETYTEPEKPKRGGKKSRRPENADVSEAAELSDDRKEENNSE
jgi:hypothetical protein